MCTPSQEKQSYHTGSTRLKVPHVRAEYQNTDWCVKFLLCPVWFLTCLINLLIFPPSYPAFSVAVFSPLTARVITIGLFPQLSMLHLKILSNTQGFQKAVVEASQPGCSRASCHPFTLSFEIHRLFSTPCYTWWMSRFRVFDKTRNFWDDS